MEKKQKRKAAREIFNQQIYQNIMEEAPDEEDNDFFEAQQQAIEVQAAPNMMPMPAALAPSPQKAKVRKIQVDEQLTSEELQQEKGGLHVRETGWGPWRTVIVPPNAYVVHTRRGQSKPVTVGLGASFRYNSRTDSYIVAPATMQTIGIVAQGISREKQGISVLAYVQWLISDFSIAYQRLDFSDIKDPMGIVSAQLREQAEAAIKDKISTMSVEEILADKATIIEELTQRLKTVAEGHHTNEEESLGGLGIKIVTVQIKEAFVSSQKLWEHLQEPFRNEREREARLSRLRVEEEIRQQELQNQKKIENAQADTQTEIDKFKAKKESESLAVIIEERLAREEIEMKEEEKSIFLKETTELARRTSEEKLNEEEETQKKNFALLQLQYEKEKAIQKRTLELERRLEEKAAEEKTRMKELEYEQRLLEYEHKFRVKELEDQKTLSEKEHGLNLVRLKNQSEIKRIQLEGEIKKQEFEFELGQKKKKDSGELSYFLREKELSNLRLEQEIKNLVQPGDLSRRLIDVLPDLAEAMPDIQEMKTLQISGEGGGGFDALNTFIAKLLAVTQSLGLPKLGSVNYTKDNDPILVKEEEKQKAAEFLNKENSSEFSSSGETSSEVYEKKELDKDLDTFEE